MKAEILAPIPDTEIEAEAHHTWHIEEWRRLDRREQGPVFQAGKQPWRVLLFPFGNNVENVSFYLEHGFDGEPPEDWYACVQFALVLWNTQDPSIYMHHTAQHRFTKREGDWGFTRFVEIRKAFGQRWEDHERALIENDEANVTAYVRVFKDPTGVLWHNFENYDSKKETGMVGLKNQGATCYLNSLLQSLYFTDAFRKAVYQIPTENDAVKTNSAWTLQRLFYQLQMSKFAVPTTELTSSFGWDSRQIFEQQDVQELSRILMERLEERMKGTEAENALPKLFVGKSKTYISCINVDFESSRLEDFWDIQLNVRGNKTLHDSFLDYIQVETLEGENKYDAGEPYKLQDAKKGVIFESFPPVLHLQLKRFEYDINRDAMMKVNDRHEFPEEFDAGQYLSPEADRSESWMYQLHSVLVHSGDFNAGHYYAFLKPKKEGWFYKFDDDRVTKATLKETLEENYGGEYANLANGALGQRQPYMRGYSTKRSMNAYMLVYIRKSRLDDVLFDIPESDLPPHIERKVAEERAELERRKKEREEAHLYLNVHLISDQTFKQHHAFDLTTWDAEPDDPAAPALHRVRRTMKLSEFAAEIAKKRGLEAEQVRFWVMVSRQNKTSRPDQPLKELGMTMEEAWSRFGSKGAPFRLWAEACDKMEDGKPIWSEASPTAATNTLILVFLKYFDVKEQTLTGIGHVYVRKHGKVSDIGAQIQSIMNWPSTTLPVLYEEIKHSMIEPMKPKQTFQQSEIQDGDIICFQQPVTDVDQSGFVYTDARQHYDYLLNRVSIMFLPRMLEGPEFNLMLSKKMTYEQFSTKVGDYLKVDPTHLRYATVNVTSNKPKLFVKRNLNQNLQQILSSQYSSYGYSNHRNDALYYEVLETSLADYETKKIMKVIWLSEGITKEEPLEILVAKSGNIGDLITGIQKKLNLDDKTAPLVRIYEEHGGKVYKELNEDVQVTGVNEFVRLYAERLPDEETDAPEEDRAIYCFHFDKEPSKPHGVPFKFVLKPGEQFKDTRERLGKRTGLKGKLLEKIKFAIISRSLYAKPRYLEDTDVIMDLLQDDEDLLGLDHVNKSRNFWNRGDSIFIR